MGVRLEAPASSEKGFGESLSETFGWAELAEIAGTLFVAGLLAFFFERFVIVRLERLAALTDNDVDDRLVHFTIRFYKGIIAFVAIIVILKILDVAIPPALEEAGIKLFRPEVEIGNYA